MALELDDAERELLIGKAVAWLERQRRHRALLAEPPEAELRVLMNMATKETMGDLEFDGAPRAPRVQASSRGSTGWTRRQARAARGLPAS